MYKILLAIYVTVWVALSIRTVGKAILATTYDWGLPIRMFVLLATTGFLGFMAGLENR